MPISLRYALTPTALLLLTSGLLGSCSSPSSPTAADATDSPAAAPAFPFGGKVDSLNGIAGHTFGEPFAAFSDLEQLSEPGDQPQFYSYKGTAGWFGKHRDRVRTQLYYFSEGKFCRFLAVGDPALLRPEALYLLGPGQAQGKNLLFWEGSRARAVYEEKAVDFGREGRLDVLSKVYEAAQAARAKAQLEADNAQ